MKLPAVLFFAPIQISTLVAGPSVTIYNQNFGVVREEVPLELKQGENIVRYADTSAHLEPDSVILRDLAGKTKIAILEQNYRADPVSSGLLLNLNEGKTIDFLVKREGQADEIVKGRIIRSGYVVHNGQAMRRYGNAYYETQNIRANVTNQPIIEVDGQLRFSLPGEPLFPALADDSILKPTLDWRLHSDGDVKLQAELCYVTGGMSWEADYNVVSPEMGDKLDLTGWITVDNQCGKTFRDAEVQLVAGDVAKLGDDSNRGFGFESADPFASAFSAPRVTSKAFDEFHLYTLPLATTLRDRETKQVEFAKAAEVDSIRLYIYDGAFIDPKKYRGWDLENIRRDENYGTESNPKVWVMREVKNTEANGLGIPLPKGRVRFYRRDEDGKLQFVGEDNIDHTPRDETLRLFTGNAFDLVGERKRTNIQRDNSNGWLEETFEIELRNRKEVGDVEIRVVEHLYRWTNWEIKENSNTFLKTDAQTIEFRIPLKAGDTHKLRYTVHYSW